MSETLVDLVKLGLRSTPTQIHTYSFPFLTHILTIHRYFYSPDERLRRVSINQCCVVSYSNTGGVGVAGPGGVAGRGAMFSHDNLTWTAKMMQGFIRSPGFNR